MVWNIVMTYLLYSGWSVFLTTANSCSEGSVTERSWSPKRILKSVKFCNPKNMQWAAVVTNLWCTKMASHHCTNFFWVTFHIWSSPIQGQLCAEASRPSTILLILTKVRGPAVVHTFAGKKWKQLTSSYMAEGESVKKYPRWFQPHISS